MSNRIYSKYEVYTPNCKILSLVYPFVDCYPATSDAMAILQAYMPNSRWFYNNFIQLYEVQNKALDFFDFSMENNPFLMYSEIDYSIISKITNLRNFIITSIDEGYYIRLFVNTKYIRLYNSDIDFYHDIMVYGYDDTNFFVSDHFNNGKFSLEKVEIDKLLKAYDILNLSKENIEQKKHISLIQLLKPELDIYRLQMDFVNNSTNEKDSLFAVDFERIKKSIEDYLMNRPTYGWYTRIRGISKTICDNHKWGISCYEVIKRHIYSLQEDKFEYFDTQSIYVECLHKKIMKDRILMLGKEGILKNCDLHEAYISELCYETKKLLYIFIKEKATLKEHRKAKNLIALVDDIIEKERIIFENILDDFHMKSM